MASRRPRLRFAILLFLLISVVAFRHPIALNAKALLLIGQEFPQVPVKPLALLTRSPEHKRLILSSSNGPIVADLFVPRPWLGSPDAHSIAAIILAVGVQLDRSSKHGLLTLASNFSRLGYVIFWPRLKTLDQGQERAEEPGTFVKAFHYLRMVPEVDPARISYFGFSVGAATALVAASDRNIAKRVRSVIFFAGFYDIFHYLAALATGEDRYGNRAISWRPRPDAIHEAKQVLKREHASSLLPLFQARTWTAAELALRKAKRSQFDLLRRLSPANHVRRLSARTFILHDRKDRYVPYLESEKLYERLRRRQNASLLLTNLFQHTEPGGGALVSKIGQLLRLYTFAYEALDYASPSDCGPLAKWLCL